MTRVHLTQQLPEATMARLSELFTVTGPQSGPIAHTAKGADVLVPTLADPIDAATIDALLPELKLIANFGAGYDHIDVAYAKSKGITISNTPSVLTEDTADATMALILAVPRRLGEAAQAVRQQTWQGWNPIYLLGHRVHGKALGIIAPEAELVDYGVMRAPMTFKVSKLGYDEKIREFTHEVAQRNPRVLFRDVKPFFRREIFLDSRNVLDLDMAA